MTDNDLIKYQRRLLELGQGARALFEDVAEKVYELERAEAIYDLKFASIYNIIKKENPKAASETVKNEVIQHEEITSSQKNYLHSLKAKEIAKAALEAMKLEYDSIKSALMAEQSMLNLHKSF